MKSRTIWPVFLFLLCCTLPGDDPKTVMVFPDANSRPTYFTLHHIREAQAISRGKGIRVGILDHSFGLELHPGLYAGGKNFVVDDDEFLTKREWHGYWMANVLREIAPEVGIYALNTISFKDPGSNAEAISKAIDWAIQQQIQVLTYSHGSIKGEAKKILNEALDRAHRAGIITTFIHTGHPENIMPCGLWPGQDDGREPDINILHYDYSVVPIAELQKLRNGEQTWWNPPFLSVSSTSPVLGGVVALMKSLRPELTREECRKILQETSRPLEFEGEKAPRVLDAAAALQRVKEFRPAAGKTP